MMRHTKSFGGHSAQRGVALIMVLLVVALAVALSTSIAKRQSEAIRSTSSHFNRQQALFYARGGEEWARQLLAQDFEARPNWDGPIDPWLARDLVYEIEGGSITLWIEDQERFLNINQWTRSASQADASLLSAQLGLDPLWIDELIDFTDIDQTPQPLGAEDYHYLGLEQPYRTSSQALVHLSELRLLRSMTPEAYSRLASSVVALPTGTLPLNVNTMPPSSIMLIAPEITPEAAEAVALLRDEQDGFDTVQAFLALPEFAGLNLGSFPLGVQSSFFKVRVRVDFLDQVVFLAALLYREPSAGKISVLHRSLNEPFASPEPSVEEEDI